ncbi:HAD family hydrolase [Rhodovulum sp. DZ06]|uniref:HAD family hydrolase n=1 Tax=Rhodovulum sp. DZ06 TaxID=3425126 RepID=UPI003D32BCF2
MAGPLVIFDCDGVLVDSEPLAVEELCAAIREAGGDMGAAEAYARFLGRSSAATARILAEDYGVILTGEILERMRLRLFARFEAELSPCPGIGAAVDAVKAAGAAVCVASSSQPERVRLSLGATRLLAKFGDAIYSSSMVENGKPAPDLFLHAARAMGAAPKDCVVVEDSAAGLRAARAAGMAALAYTGGGHAGPGRLAELAATLSPDAIYDDHARLPALLGGLGLGLGPGPGPGAPGTGAPGTDAP